MRTWVLIPALLAVPAWAQDTSCYRTGNIVNCHTDQPVAPNSNLNEMYQTLMRGAGAGRTVADNQQQQLDIQQRQLEIQQLRQLQAERDRRDAIASVAATPPATDYKAIHARAAANMVAAGKCGDAVSYLKAVDEFDMAQSTSAICAKP